MRAKFYLKQKNYADAIKDLSKIIELKPKDPQTYSVRGFAYGQLGQIDKEKGDCEKAISLDPQNKIHYLKHHSNAFK